MGVSWFPSILTFTCKLRNNVMLFYKSNCKEREREWPTTNMIRDRDKNIFILAF